MTIEYDKDFGLLLTAAIEIGNAIHGHDLPEGKSYLKYAEGLGHKVIRHIVSAWHLNSPYILQLDGKQFAEEIDFASIAILTRSALETYLVFNYIFTNSDSDEEQRFRFQTWHLAGFLERANMPATTREHLDKAQYEKKETEKLRTELKDSPSFSKLTPNQQQQILKGDWRMRLPWHVLATKAGFSTDFFVQQYKFLSSYAHAGRLSVMQIQQANTLMKQKELSRSFVAILMILLAKFTADYLKVIPHYKGVKLKTEHLQIIQNWSYVAEGLKKWEASNK